MTQSLIGRGLLVLAGVAALFAAAISLQALGETPAERLWAEIWRAFGLPVFAGLFFVLAWRPTRSPMLWELTFAHKAAMAGAALALPDVPEAADSGLVDAILCVILVIAWVLTRGWRSWRDLSPEPTSSR